MISLSLRKYTFIFQQACLSSMLQSTTIISSSSSTDLVWGVLWDQAPVYSQQIL